MEQRYNVVRKHVRDFFYLQRHLMLSKQEKDLEHLRQLNAKLEEDLVRRQNEEKRLFLKSLRQEQRSRREMYRRSLYIVPAQQQQQQASNAQQSSTPSSSSSALDSCKLSADEEKRKLKEVYNILFMHSLTRDSIFISVFTLLFLVRGARKREVRERTATFDHPTYETTRRVSSQSG